MVARIKARMPEGGADLPWSEILEFATDDEFEQMEGMYEQLQAQEEGATTGIAEENKS
jgi:hypothetical protein